LRAAGSSGAAGTGFGAGGGTAGAAFAGAAFVGPVEGGPVEGGTVEGGTVEGGTVEGGPLEGGTVEGVAEVGGLFGGGLFGGGLLGGGELVTGGAEATGVVFGAPGSVPAGGVEVSAAVGLVASGVDFVSGVEPPAPSVVAGASFRGASPVGVGVAGAAKAGALTRELTRMTASEAKVSLSFIGPRRMLTGPPQGKSTGRRLGQSRPECRRPNPAYHLGQKPAESWRARRFLPCPSPVPGRR
jgi:hypothetical protein